MPEGQMRRRARMRRCALSGTVMCRRPCSVPRDPDEIGFKVRLLCPKA